MAHPVHQTKILSCRSEVLEIAAGRFPAPRTVELFVTSACNHDCTGCHTRALRTGQPRHIDPARLDALLREWRGMGVQGLEISGVGEPLLYPSLGWLLEHAAGLGFQCGLLTNGSLLHTADMGLLVRNTRFIRISYDSCRRDTYRRITGADDLARVEENVAALAAARRKARSDTAIGLKTLLSRPNLGQVREIAERAAALGVDYIQFKCLRNSKAAPTAAQAARAEAGILTAALLSKKRGFKVVSATGKALLDAPCFLSPLHPVVDPALNLFVCPYYTHHPASHKIGSLRTKSFASLWGSAAHRRAVSGIDSSICNIFDCPLIPFNNFARTAIIADDMHLSFI